MRIKAEINETENSKSTEKINETKSWFLEKISKIDKPLARLAKINEGKHRFLISEIKKETSLLIPWTLKG